MSKLVMAIAALLACSCVAPPAASGQPPATTQAPLQAAVQAAVQFPSVEVDRASRQVRVSCQALAVEAPLEFFCVTSGGPEHESVLRTAAKPSHIHAGLLMLGMEPGSPMRYREAQNSWTPPFGPPVRVSVEWRNADGSLVRKPAEALLQSTKDPEKPVPAMGWIFAGSHQREDGAYLADLTGYVVSLCNFEHTLIDVPRLVSSANETLEWAYALDRGPQRGQAVTMILEPIGAAPTTRPATQPVQDEQADARELAAVRDHWRAAVKPHEAALQDAARAHYEVLEELRRRQQKLVEEADRLQSLIDELDRAYQEMTTPKPR